MYFISDITEISPEIFISKILQPPPPLVIEWWPPKQGSDAEPYECL